MNVVTACAGRFHLFDQARQLDRCGLLHALVTDLPASRAVQWGVPRSRVRPCSKRTVTNRLYHTLAKNAPFAIRSALTRAVHSGFARSLPSRVPEDANALIVHSSFALEALPWIKERGISVIIDHGSLHEKTERDILISECEAYGFSRFGNWQYPWLIQREDHEFNQADHILVCSKLARQTLEYNGIDPNKIFVNQLGTDLSMFFPSEKHDAVFRIIFCGGVHPRKGVHYLLRAFNELKLPNAELWIIGGISVDRVMRKYICPYFSQENICYKGTIPQQKLRELYVQGSLFVLPSLADGWGMVVLQAMACGLPVIVTDMTGASEAVKDGVNGFVIPSRSSDLLKETLLWCYEHQEEARCMGMKGLQTVKSGYSWEEYGDRLVGFFGGDDG